MNCYQALVANRFLANAPAELSSAKRILLNTATMATHKSTKHTFDMAEAEALYYSIGNNLGFFEEIYKIKPQANKIYYLNYDVYMMICSRNKRMLDTAISAAHNVNGDVPMFRKKHTIQRKIVHVALFNTNFTVPPASLN